jgi:cell division protein FtsB
MRLELAARREETAALRQMHEKLYHDWQALTAEAEYLRQARDDLTSQNQRLSDQLAEVQQALTTVQNMKVVRWTVRPRRIVYRLHGRG